MASNATKTREHRQDGRGNTSTSALAERKLQGVMTNLREYARENPESAALWCFGIGFVLGWKLKPW